MNKWNPKLTVLVSYRAPSLFLLPWLIITSCTTFFSKYLLLVLSDNLEVVGMAATVALVAVFSCFGRLAAIMVCLGLARPGMEESCHQGVFRVNFHMGFSRSTKPHN